MKQIMQAESNPTGRKKRKKAVFAAGTITFFLMISILQPAAVFSDPSVGAATISQLNENQEKIAQQIAAVKKQQEALKKQAEALKENFSELNIKTEEAKKKYQELLDDKEAAFTEMQNSLAEAAAAAANAVAQQEQNKKSLQVMFENRNKSTLEMLFDAKDIKGFLANIQLIDIIAQSNQKILESLVAAQDEALLKKKAAEEYCAEMQAVVDQKDKEIKNLENNKNQTQEEIDAANKKLEEAKKSEKALQEDNLRIAAEIKKLQSSSAYYGGTMVWPAPGYTSINASNGFGMRMHPVYHYMRMHSGVDINAPFDAKIVAAADGKVIVAGTIPGYNPVTGNNYGGTNYGNYIVIDHGGGISSTYAHCKLLKVKVGDTVKAGNTIAIAGSTGLSTGAHLHFEIRENGTPVDPLQTKYLGVKK